MKKHSVYLKLILLLPVLAMIACSDDPLLLDNEVTSAVEYATLQHEFNQIALMFHMGAIMSDGLNQQMEMSGLLSLCSTIAIETTGSDTTLMTIDFGEECNCIDRKIRSGKLLGIFIGKWNEPQATVFISPIDYRIISQEGEEFKFEFMQEMHKQTGENNVFILRHNIDSARVVNNDRTIHWKADQSISWKYGRQTVEMEDDIYFISGTSKGKSSNDLQFEVAMLQPLEISFSCPYTLGGVIAFTPENKKTRLVDFGQGTCDTRAEVEIAGFTRSISW